MARGAAPADWSHLAELLNAAGARVQPAGDGAQAAAELHRQLAMNLAQGYFLLFQSTPDHPEFSPFENSVFLAQPNPDAVYYYAPVDDAGTYRVVGERGDAPVVGFAVGARIIGMDPSPGKGLGNFDVDDLALNEDGSFETIFSRERPPGHDGNWLPLAEGADFILVRQFSYDWGRERDVRLAIERLDAAPIRPRLTASEIDAKLEHLFGGYVANLAGICSGAVEKTRRDGFVNRMRITTFQDLGNSQSWPQAYFETVFELGADEALILESELPEQRPYWNVQVIDPLWNQLEFVYRQTSLNGRQARVDADGRFRAVLAHQDPGFANWLDTAGHASGMLIGRWYRCSSHPTPEVRKVKFADLAREMPAHSPLITADKRAQALRERRIGAQLRRRW